MFGEHNEDAFRSSISTKAFLLYSVYGKKSTHHELNKKIDFTKEDTLPNYKAHHAVTAYDHGKIQQKTETNPLSVLY